MSVKKTLKQYKLLQNDLTSRLEELELKREVLHSTLPSNLDEIVTGEIRLEEEEESYDLGYDGEESNSPHKRLIQMKKERLKATDVLLRILQIKMTFITDMVHKLESYTQANPQLVTPFELQLARFYDWVETNQQIYELNTQLYEIEKSKFKMEKPNRGRLIKTIDFQSIIATESLGALTAQPFNKFDSSVMAVSLYVTERLQPRDQRMTFEASKIEEYIEECRLFHNGIFDIVTIKGAHPQSYHAFVEILCNYIVERHRSSQGEDLPYATIYTAIEHNVMPHIKPYVLKYINKTEDDRILQEQCDKFANITLSQLRIPLNLRSKELVPFADAIAHMRATYFSQSPTDKMFSVVAAAKALHEQLNSMDEGSIDGDTFLDFWVYVTIKANVKDMATNVMFMSEYGNPQLSIAEAGYYLTTLYAAISYIKSLTHDMLQKQEENDSVFLMCELDHVKLLTSCEGTCMELIGQTELGGYKIAAVKKWLMDTSRLYSTVLVETGNAGDKVQLAMIKLSSNLSASHHVEYFYELLTSHDMPGVACRCIREGLIMLADSQQCGEELVILNSRIDITRQLVDLKYVTQLIRLGSETIEEDDTEILLAHAPLPTQHSPFSFIPSPNNGLSSIEEQLDYDEKGKNRTRFSLPTKPELRRHKINKEKVSSPSMVNKRSSQHEGIQLPRGITVTAEVYSTSPGLSSIISGQSVEKDGGKDLILSQESQRSMVTSSEVSFTSSTATIPGPSLTIPLSHEYIIYLEDNYSQNHLYGNRNSSIKENVFEVTKQCQMMLQKLNFLSSFHSLNGVYDNATMNAVQSFQVLHNLQDNFSSVRLPENGILTVATSQYLRQELLTIFANLMRLRKDVGLDSLSNFDPLSTDPNDMKQFYELVKGFQEKEHIRCLSSGVLCARTVGHIKLLVQKQRTFSARSERGMTL